MKKRFARLMLLVVLSLFTSESIFSQPVTKDEATAAAKNWVAAVTKKFGSWGNYKSAYVQSVDYFLRGKRVLGYVARINPQGYIIVSLRKEAVPIIGYSATSDIDPASDRGLTDVFKLSAERVLNAIEKESAVKKTTTARSLTSLFEVDNTKTWTKLLSGSLMTESDVNNRQKVNNYVEGTILLTSEWRQGDPYNIKCPPGDACDHSLVGCISTAGSQIMRYYSWPPSGSDSPYNHDYDWASMPNKLNMYSSNAEKDAVATLCHDVGLAAGMSYGCGESTAWLGDKPGKDMLDAYEDHFRYDSNASLQLRSSFVASFWFEMIKANINANQPVQYAIETSWLFGGHSIVCDGWQVTGGVNFYHMNYGGAVANDGWYAEDNLEGSKTHVTEMMIVGIRPRNTIGPVMTGNYGKLSFPWRYIDVDAQGADADFAAGQNIQFLPGTKITSTNLITFHGNAGSESRLFSYGTSEKGIKIYNGGIKLLKNGSIRFLK